MFDYLTPEHLTPDKRLFLQPVTTLEAIPFMDSRTDCIVLEIQMTNEAGDRFPPPFTVFSIPHLDKSFRFLSHPDARQMCTEKVTTILDPQGEQTKRDIEAVRQMSTELLQSNSINQTVFKLECGDDNKLDNPERFLFHTTFSHGASGSPGVVVRSDGKVAVVTMLLHGYPDWYYNEKCENIKQYWDKSYCVEQGALMACIFVKMKERNPRLCENIFP